MIQYPNNLSPKAQEHFNKSRMKAYAISKLMDAMAQKALCIPFYITEKEIDDAVDSQLENKKGNIEQDKYLGRISEQQKNLLITEQESIARGFKDYLKSRLMTK